MDHQAKRHSDAPAFSDAERAIKALRRMRGPHLGDGIHESVNAYALADLIERLSVDATRYRWLRDVGDETWVPFGKRPGVQFTHQIDAAIDAALAKRATA